MEAKPLHQRQKTRILGRRSKNCSHLYSGLLASSHVMMEGSVAYPPPSVCPDLVSGSFWAFGIPTLRGTFFERLMYELPESPQRMSWAITPDGKLHDYFIDQ